MRDSNLPEAELLKAVLQPLLEDFQYWFARAGHMLETEQIGFMTIEGQSDLLSRVKQAQEKVNAAKMMFSATDGQVGIDMEAMMPWHQLVTECWNVAIRFRQEREARES
jgi:hypothetical protein